jgi:hypothetical protein
LFSRESSGPLDGRLQVYCSATVTQVTYSPLDVTLKTDFPYNDDLHLAVKDRDVVSQMRLKLFTYETFKNIGHIINGALNLAIPTLELLRNVEISV